MAVSKRSLSNPSKPVRQRAGPRVLRQATTGRLEARISRELQERLKQAAALEGRTVTDYVIAAVEDATRRTIEETAIIRLSAADSRRFAEALINPPASAPALVRAMKRHKDLLGE
jgi:uncharacterized protein (DUF1778 family)